MAEDVIELDDRRPCWLVTKARCSACGYGCIATVHQQADKDRLECGGCHRSTLVVTHELWSDAVWRPRFEVVRANE